MKPTTGTHAGAGAREVERRGPEATEIIAGGAESRGAAAGRPATDTLRGVGGAPRTPPPREPTPANYLRSAIAIPLIYLYTVLMATLSLALSLHDPRGRRQHWCARTWSRLIARTAGARVRVHGAGHVRPGVSYVFLSTHQSYMDIPVMLGYLPAQLRIAAKREVFQIPFLGWHMRRAGHISINRGVTTEAVASLQRATAGIRDGVCAFLFPEGTRSRDGSLQPFKKGGFKLAMQAGAPVVPVTIVGSRQVLPRDSVVFRPGPVEMYVGRPLPTDRLSDEDLPALMQAVRDEMAKHFQLGPECVLRGGKPEDAGR